MEFKLMGFNHNMPHNITTKIPHIKQLRIATSIGLREAKELIEGEVVEIIADPEQFIERAKMGGFDIEVYLYPLDKAKKLIADTVIMAMHHHAEPEFLLKLNAMFQALNWDHDNLYTNIVNNLHDIIRLALQEQNYEVVELAAAALNINSKSIFKD